MRHISTRRGGRSQRRGLAVLLMVGLFISSLGPVALAETLYDEPFEDDTFPEWPLEPPEGVPEPDPEPAPWEPNWIDVRSADKDNTTVAPGYSGNGLDINLPAGTQRGVGARYRFLLEEDPEEIWFRYMLRFDEWFSAVDGKLPGPAGLYGSSARGCIPSTPTNRGWSARILYKQSGYNGTGLDQTQIGYYVYHVNQPGDCGENMLWGPGLIDHGRWACIEGRVSLNDLGQANGRLEGWLDGELAFQRTDLEFRRADGDSVRVREFWLNLFYGGNVSPASDLGITIDQLVISDSNRIGCFDPFEDDDGSVHEPALTELRNRDIYFGCAVLESCSLEGLSRYAMAVLLDRALDLPSTSEDFFDDDVGHWAAPAINRLAAAGITLGCEERLFCVDEIISRAQFSAMLDRAFEFPTPTEDAFDDDNGYWAEDVLNALAGAGVMAGCEPRMACPSEMLSRGQAATLILRALDWAEAN
ncbi:MAG TPA: S-layer homology domain-containing protein [Actinobacteria bacterium]|nr:S-layer homology domain-containing protein [Actinomycetota bacterium]